MRGRIEHSDHGRAVRQGGVEADHLQAVFICVHPHLVGDIGWEEDLGAHPADAIALPFAIRGELKLHFVPRRRRTVHGTRLVDAIVNAVVELRDGQGVAVFRVEAIDHVQVFNDRFV